MKSSFASVDNSCLENTISTILEHLGRKKESYPGKYLSRDHISGNLLFPFSATQKPPVSAIGSITFLESMSMLHC